MKLSMIVTYDYNLIIVMLFIQPITVTIVRRIIDNSMSPDTITLCPQTLIVVPFFNSVSELL